MTWDLRRGMKVALSYLALFLGALTVVYVLPIESVAHARSQLAVEGIVLGAVLGAIVFGFIFGLKLKGQ